MGLEGAVRLGYRRELDAIADPDERERRSTSWSPRTYEHGKALNVGGALRDRRRDRPGRHPPLDRHAARRRARRRRRGAARSAPTSTPGDVPSRRGANGWHAPSRFRQASGRRVAAILPGTRSVEHLGDGEARSDDVGCQLPPPGGGGSPEDRSCERSESERARASEACCGKTFDTLRAGSRRRCRRSSNTLAPSHAVGTVVDRRCVRRSGAARTSASQPGSKKNGNAIRSRPLAADAVRASIGSAPPVMRSSMSPRLHTSAPGRAGRRPTRRGAHLEPAAVVLGEDREQAVVGVLGDAPARIGVGVGGAAGSGRSGTGRSGRRSGARSNQSASRPRPSAIPPITRWPRTVSASIHSRTAGRSPGDTRPVFGPWRRNAGRRAGARRRSSTPSLPVGDAAGQLAAEGEPAAPRPPAAGHRDRSAFVVVGGRRTRAPALEPRRGASRVDPVADDREEPVRRGTRRRSRGRRRRAPSPSSTGSSSSAPTSTTGTDGDDTMNTRLRRVNSRALSDTPRRPDGLYKRRDRYHPRNEDERARLDDPDARWRQWGPYLSGAGVVHRPRGLQRGRHGVGLPPARPRAVPGVSVE